MGTRLRVAALACSYICAQRRITIAIMLAMVVIVALVGMRVTSNRNNNGK